MAASLAALANAYDSDSNEENTEPAVAENYEEFLKNPIDPKFSTVSTISIDAAPMVLYNGVSSYIILLNTI